MRPASPRPATGEPAGTVRVLKRDGGRGVFLVVEGGTRSVVKRWPLTPWEAVKLVLGIAQAQRQLRGARRLRAAGIRTGEPRGGVRLRLDHGLHVEIRLAWMEGELLLHRLRSADAELSELLGRRMGELLRRLADAGLFHRDAKLTNFVVDADGEIVALDPVGVRASRDTASERERLRRTLLCELSPDEARRCQPFIERALATR